MVFFQAEIDITSSVEGIPPIDFRVAPSFFHTCLHSLIGCGEVNCIARGEAPSDLYPIYLPTYLPTFRTYLGTLSYRRVNCAYLSAYFRTICLRIPAFTH